ncbi:MAG: hypothetical protein ACI85K_002612 [Hyphomicrobiaceae bacterium]|jgi:hypothetical protein
MQTENTFLLDQQSLHAGLHLTHSVAATPSCSPVIHQGMSTAVTEHAVLAEDRPWQEFGHLFDGLLDEGSRNSVKAYGAAATQGLVAYPADVLSPGL